MIKLKDLYKKVILLLFFSLIFFSSKTYASEKKEGIENFPDSYKPYLLELNKNYPNWKFVALYTNLDWNYVIDQENIFGKNLVPKSYSDIWKNTKQGEYNVEVDAGWVDCSRKAVEYTMDPRNFLNEVRIFQFEGLSYEERDNLYDGIEKILYGTEFYNRIVEYRDSSLNLITTDKKYADLILKGGQTSKVSVYHLASRIKQEVGPFLSHSSISGIVQGFEGLYNFYNIGATSSSEPMGAIKNGLRYARDGQGASEATKTKYKIPWTTKEIAVEGGAIFIGSSYINQGQNTIYLQKFDVNDEKPGELFWHQYMTNVLAPYSESKSIYNGYSNSQLLNSNMTFIIPVYDNMPQNPTENLNISQSDFTEDNTKVYADVTGTLNVRNGPGTSYEVLTRIDRNQIVTRIALGKQSGDLWDKIKLDNGIVGYVFHNYLKEAPDVQVEEINLSLEKSVINKNEKIKLNVEIIPNEAKESLVTFSSSATNVALVDGEGNILGVGGGSATITATAANNVSKSIDITVYSPVTDIDLDTKEVILQIGEEFQINPIIYPNDASNKKVEFKLSDDKIAKIDENGKITAISQGKCNIFVTTQDGGKQVSLGLEVIPKIDETQIKFVGGLKANGNIITGLDYKNNSVGSVKNNIITDYNVEFCNSKNELLSNESLVGTGSKIVVKKQDGNILIEYMPILYGDVNGDGKINSIDLLVLQRHILEIQKLEGNFLKAGNINKNGKNPSSLDSLLIQRHILELKFIEQ